MLNQRSTQEKILLIIFALMFSNIVIAQSRSTNETKLTLVVNKENTKILDVELFDQKEAENIKKRYPGSRLFIGLLKGSYELEKRRVKPNTGAIITIFTERQFFPNEKFFTREELNTGDQLNIGAIKARITSSAKGELILTTQ